MTTKPEAKSFDHDYTPPYADKLYIDCLAEAQQDLVKAGRGDLVFEGNPFSIEHIELAKLKMQSVIASNLITLNINLTPVTPRSITREELQSGVKKNESS